MQFWLLAGLAGLSALGLGQKLQEAGIHKFPLLPDLAGLVPFLAGLILMWVLDYPFHRALRQRLSASMVRQGQNPLPCWTPGQYLVFNLRHNLLFIAVPVGLIILGADAVRLYLPGLLPENFKYGEGVLIAASLVIATGVFLVAPLLVVRLWKTSPLPDGDLRRNLESMSRRMKIRYRDILIWRSGGVLANAGAMGLIGRVRYLLLSDALLENMNVETIRSIFAHEVGHIRKHHIFYAGMFAISSGLLCIAAGWGLAVGIFHVGWLRDFIAGAFVDVYSFAEIVTLVLLAATWTLGFGFISKRFERQSDVIGAWASGPDRPPDDPRQTKIDPVGAEIFAAALLKVAKLNGISLDRRNWRHGRMSDRIGYVRSLAYSGGTRRDIDRLVRRIKVVLWAALLAGLALMVFMSSLFAPEA
jgi:Zn-dependent protease with chaperone function